MIDVVRCVTREDMLCFCNQVRLVFNTFCEMDGMSGGQTEATLAEYRMNLTQLIVSYIRDHLKYLKDRPDHLINAVACQIITGTDDQVKAHIEGLIPDRLDNSMRRPDEGRVVTSADMITSEQIDRIEALPSMQHLNQLKNIEFSAKVIEMIISDTIKNEQGLESHTVKFESIESFARYLKTMMDQMLFSISTYVEEYTS